MRNYYQIEGIFTMFSWGQYIVLAMKNAASIFKLIYFGTKIGFFVYFFQDLLRFIS